MLSYYIICINFIFVIIIFKKKVVIFDYITHAVTAVIVAYILDYFLLDLNILETICFYLFVILGSWLPDIDTNKSFLGSKFKLLSTFLFTTFGHRTLTHSILLITIIYFISVVIFGINTINSGIVIGMFTHVLGDMLSGRVAALYPFSKKRIGIK